MKFGNTEFEMKQDATCPKCGREFVIDPGAEIFPPLCNFDETPLEPHGDVELTKRPID